MDVAVKYAIETTKHGILYTSIPGKNKKQNAKKKLQFTNLLTFNHSLLLYLTFLYI